MTNIIYHTAGHNQGERVGPRARDPGIQGPERDGRGSGGAMETLGACREGCWIEENSRN